MNIFTAPLAYLAKQVPDKGRPRPPMGDVVEFQVDTGPKVGAGCFVPFAILLTFLLALAGVYMLFTGTPGDIVIEGGGIKLTTKTGGLALIGLALIFYLAFGKLIMDLKK